MKIDVYPRHRRQDEKTHFMHRNVVQKIFTHSASLKNGPVWKNSFTPMTHERKEALNVQNCTKTIGPFEGW